jgi:RNA polymerase sigma-70 factor (ECF subfamily)
MDERDLLAARFEANRGHLRAVAYRMLGSLHEADDAVQETWLRLSRTDTTDVANLGGWLTTVVGRVCLDILRSRRSRREELMGAHLPDPIVDDIEAIGPEHQALLADSVGLALLVVLEMLDPAERLAFVLHDMFGVPFDEIAGIVDRSPAATRQLASRARRRVRGAPTVSEPDLGRQREVVDAFIAAAHGGDFDALVAVLDPDVVLRVDTGAGLPGAVREIRGARTVAGQAIAFRQPDRVAQPALVNGAVGIVNTVDGQPISVMGLTIVDGKITEMDIVADPERLRRLDIR